MSGKQRHESVQSDHLFILYTTEQTDSTDYLTISGFTSLNGLICLHSVLDKAGSQSVFKRT